MATTPTTESAGAAAEKPGLVFFYSPVSGQCRRVEAYIAQVMQHRQNHNTFKLYRVNEIARPDLVQRFGITSVPTIAVVTGKSVVATLERPRGAAQIQSFLAPWLN